MHSYCHENSAASTFQPYSKETMPGPFCSMPEVIFTTLKHNWPIRFETSSMGVPQFYPIRFETSNFPKNFQIILKTWFRSLHINVKSNRKTLINSKSYFYFDMKTQGVFESNPIFGLRAQNTIEKFLEYFLKNKKFQIRLDGTPVEEVSNLIG